MWFGGVIFWSEIRENVSCNIAKLKASMGYPKVGEINGTIIDNHVTFHTWQPEFDSRRLLFFASAKKSSHARIAG